MTDKPQRDADSLRGLSAIERQKLAEKGVHPGINPQSPRQIELPRQVPEEVQEKTAKRRPLSLVVILLVVVAVVYRERFVTESPDVFSGIDKTWQTLRNQNAGSRQEPANNHEPVETVTPALPAASESDSVPTDAPDPDLEQLEAYYMAALERADTEEKRRHARKMLARLAQLAPAVEAGQEPRALSDSDDHQLPVGAEAGPAPVEQAASPSPVEQAPSAPVEQTASTVPDEQAPPASAEQPVPSGSPGTTESTGAGEAVSATAETAPPALSPSVPAPVQPQIEVTSIISGEMVGRQFHPKSTGSVLMVYFTYSNMNPGLDQDGAEMLTARLRMAGDPLLLAEVPLLLQGDRGSKSFAIDPMLPNRVNGFFQLDFLLHDDLLLSEQVALEVAGEMGE